MAKIEFELNDSNGVDTQIGDEIEVTIPEVEIRDRWDEITFYRPQVTARAKVLCPPSKGLQVRILEIIDRVAFDDDILSAPNEYQDTKIDIGCNIGDRLQFPRTVWHWRNLTSASTGAPNPSSLTHR